jgi:hypothetical protein
MRPRALLLYLMPTAQCYGAHPIPVRWCYGSDDRPEPVHAFCAPGMPSTRLPEAVMQRTHSMTSSARASSIGGMVRPRPLAVCRLTVISNLIDCSTGRSAGFPSKASAPRLLRLLPAGAKVAGWVCLPLGDRAFPRRTSRPAMSGGLTVSGPVGRVVPVQRRPLPRLRRQTGRPLLASDQPSRGRPERL